MSLSKSLLNRGGRRSCGHCTMIHVMNSLSCTFQLHKDCTNVINTVYSMYSILWSCLLAYLHNHFMTFDCYRDHTITLFIGHQGGLGLWPLEHLPPRT